MSVSENAGEMPAASVPDIAASVPDIASVPDVALGTDGSSINENGALSDSHADLYTDDGRNATKIRCLRCSSLVLSPGNARLTSKELFLPHMQKKSANQEANDGETLTKHWLVSDMFIFDNVGFTNTVDGKLKYLICADCEVGPIGWHDTNIKKEFYISLDRVKHDR